MLKTGEPTDFPAFLDLDLTLFKKVKKDWLLWRMCGSHDVRGNFQPDIVAFISARREIPKDELDMYFELDRLVAIRQRQRLAKEPK